MSNNPNSNVDPRVGLTAQQVADKQKLGQTNKVKKVVGKSILQIFATNIFTFFNFLGFLIFVLMAFFGEVSEMMFIVVILSNTVIGIFQEIRSKIAVEKLSVVSEPTATVVRDGEDKEISTDQVVLDDIVKLNGGNQICADCVIVSGELEVDESMLTGESLPVKKHVGNTLYRGSFVTSGNCLAQVTCVGRDTYIEQLSAKVKRAKVPDSQLIKGIMKIMKLIAIIIFPLGFCTFLLHTDVLQLFRSGVGFFQMWQQYFAGNPTVVEAVRAAVQSASGSMLGMVPSGMVLLTSIALAVGALKLARKKVLVRELPCIEMLARVDTLCLDKTGTITDGTMSVEDVVCFGKADKQQVVGWIGSIVAATGDRNSTALAIEKYCDGVQTIDSTANLPFSSQRKLSAATLQGVGTVAFGAAEFMFDRLPDDMEQQCKSWLNQGLRVLAVGKTDSAIDSDGNVIALEPVALVALSDTMRADAKEIVKWFADNNVDVKVISGDNPLSVSVIAQKVGVVNADKYVSLEGMTDDEVAQVANKYTVFGRVTPEQKAVLVRAMKQNGRTVAMMGDGVNDILAMRESDCAVSVGCGTDAAKTVANLVLTDNQFGSLPRVVAEGRQVVNNVQNSTSLFLMKTTMVVFITLLTIILSIVSVSSGGEGVSFPFRPSNLSAVSLCITGIASFLMALKPNHNLIKGNFLLNTFKSTVPSGIAMFLSVAAVFVFEQAIGIQNEDQFTTAAMYAMTFTAVLSLWVLCFPFDWYNVAVASLCSVVATGFLLFFQPVYLWAMRLFDPSFVMERPYVVALPSKAILFVVLDVVVMCCVIIGLRILMDWLERRKTVKVAESSCN